MCNVSPHPIIFVGDCLLAKVLSVRYLGVQINSDLSWSTHITNLCIKARRFIGLLYRRFYKNADTQTLLQLYKTFIRPELEYCSIVWDPYLAKDIEVLEKVQRFGLRVCLKKWDLSIKCSLVGRQKISCKANPLYKIINELTDSTIVSQSSPLQCQAGKLKATCYSTSQNSTVPVSFPDPSPRSAPRKLNIEKRGEGRLVRSCIRAGMCAQLIKCLLVIKLEVCGKWEKC